MTGISDFIRSIGPTRLIAGISILSLIGGALATAMIRLSDEDMAVLFTDLDIADASQIIEELRSRKIPYEQRRNGSLILVPSEQVFDLRMQFASEGLPARGVAGYELLDNQNALGTTSFLQNVNYVRALEGELSRTIRSMDAVRSARVFLNLPKRELFAREQPKASASIQIDTRGGTLSRSQVQAIQYLVASAVEGLSPQRVSVIDASGNVLATGQDDGPSAIAGSVEERKQMLERRLSEKISGILNRIVGPSNARVQVSAEMTLNRIVEETQVYDPERQVVLSTSTTEVAENEEDKETDGTVSVGNNLPEGETETAQTGRSATSNRTVETVNYENSLTKRTEVQEAGRLERLSIAVVVNYLETEDEDGNVTYTERNEEELQKIENLVRAAVGFSEQRGDLIQVISTQFSRPPELEAEPEPEAFFGLKSEDIPRLVESLALIILGIIFLFALQPLLRRLFGPTAHASDGAMMPALGEDGQPVPQLAGPDGAPAAAGEDGGENAIENGDDPAALPAPSDKDKIGKAIDIARVEGEVKESSIRKVGEIVSSHPEEALSILRTWLHETG